MNIIKLAGVLLLSGKKHLKTTPCKYHKNCQCFIPTPFIGRPFSVKNHTLNDEPTKLHTAPLKSVGVTSNICNSR